MSPKSGHPPIQAGERLVIHATSGVAVEVTVDRVGDQLIWFKGRDSEIRPGDLVLLERTVAGDARYRAPAEVAVDSPGAFALRTAGVWEREQQRSYVRISTYGIQLEAEGPEAEPARAARPRRYAMENLSAGGARFRADDNFSKGQEMVCHFELPEEMPFALAARVVRLEHRPRGILVAVEFLHVTNEQRGELLRWIYREQVRRHRGRRFHA